MKLTGSLVYDWLLSAGDEKLAKTFKKEAKAEPLPPNSPRLADIVKQYKETSPQKRKAEPVVNGSAKKAKKDERSSLLSSLFKSCPLFSCTEILNSPVIAHHQVLELLLIHHSINFLKIVFIQLFN